VNSRIVAEHARHEGRTACSGRPGDRSSAKTIEPSRPSQRQVDVAGVAFALVVLRHEGDRLAVRGGDRLRAVFVDDVVVAGAQGLVIEEADLVLTQVALPLGRLDDNRPAAYISLRMSRSTGSTLAPPRIE
jgi:hypothetical protein